jgi:hypothetical protein
MRVRELSKRVGQIPRVGKVLRVRGRTVDVEWADGHVSSITGAYLDPVRSTRT